VLIENVRDVQGKLQKLSEQEPKIFARYFDKRILHVPMVRISPKHPIVGIMLLVKDGEKEAGEPRNADVIMVPRWCVVAATPGGIYGMVKERWGNKDLFGHYFCHCLVL